MEWSPRLYEPNLSAGCSEWVGAVGQCVLFDGHRSPAEVRFVEQAARAMTTREGETLYFQASAVPPPSALDHFVYI